MGAVSLLFLMKYMASMKAFIFRATARHHIEPSIHTDLLHEKYMECLQEDRDLSFQQGRNSTSCCIIPAQQEAYSCPTTTESS
jgi:hypothetical protein